MIVSDNIATCDVCGSDINRASNQLTRANNHFCDPKCRGVWQSEMMKGKRFAAKPDSTFDQKEYSRSWYVKNKDRVSKKQHEYYEENKDKILERQNSYYEENKYEIIRKQGERRRVNGLSPQAAVKQRLRCRVLAAVKARSGKKIDSTMNLVGCGLSELMSHLQETAIKNGYSDFDINNYSGDEYHIDHIKPCSSFDLTLQEEQTTCFHHKNLQILSATENLKKHATITI